MTFEVISLYYLGSMHIKLIYISPSYHSGLLIPHFDTTIVLFSGHIVEKTATGLLFSVFDIKISPKLHPICDTFVLWRKREISVSTVTITEQEVAYL